MNEALTKAVQRKTNRGHRMEKTIAVIGGSGFVGRATIEVIAKHNARVLVLCRNAERAKYLKPMGDVGQITLVSGDACDDETLEGVIAPADAVVNLIGILAETGSQKFSALQAELPGRIGALAAKHNVESVVHVSAIGASASSPSIYSRTKASGEAALLSAFSKAVIVRPSIVFGAGDNFFNRFASMATVAPALPLPDGGGMLMQPVYVGDVAAAIAAGLDLTKTKRKMISSSMTIDFKLVWFFNNSFVTITGNIPHNNLVTFFNHLTIKINILLRNSSHVSKRCLPSNNFRDHVRNQ